MVPRTARADADVAVLTASETPFDALAVFVSAAPLEDVLPRVADAVLA